MSPLPPTSEDARWMQRCLELAREAAAADEVPVGALVVLDGAVVGEGRNRVEAQRSPLAHAEMEALQRAFATVGAKRLPEAVLYCTLEPCFLCASGERCAESRKAGRRARHFIRRRRPAERAAAPRRTGPSPPARDVQRS